MKAEQLKIEINHILDSGSNDIRLIELFERYAKSCCEAQRIACAENARTKDDIIRSSEHPDFDYAEVDTQSILETPLTVYFEFGKLFVSLVFKTVS